MAGWSDPDAHTDGTSIAARTKGTRSNELPIARWQDWWQQAARHLNGDPVNGDPAAALAARHGFVVTGGMLRSIGWQRHDVRRELRRGNWVRVAQGVFSPVVVPDDDLARRRAHALRACSLALVRPGHVITGRSGAILHGVPTFAVPQRPILTTPGFGAPGYRSSALIRIASMDAHAQTSWFGAPVFTVARTVVDLARLDRRDGIMAADAALREGIVTPTELAVELIGAAGWPGIVQARAIIDLADPRAESPLESLVRLALLDDKFPPPQPQYWIGDDRVDLCWPEQRLALEADGRAKYSDSALWEEKKREARLRARGFAVERVIWADVVKTWPTTRRRLRDHFAR